MDCLKKQTTESQSPCQIPWGWSWQCFVEMLLSDLRSWIPWRTRTSYCSCLVLWLLVHTSLLETEMISWFF